jgi:hypothetical protein
LFCGFDVTTITDLNIYRFFLLEMRGTAPKLIEPLPTMHGGISV